MVHFVRALLAGCVVGVDSFPICLALVAAIPAYRDHDAGCIRADSDATVSAGTCAGLARVMSQLLTKALKGVAH